MPKARAEAGELLDWPRLVSVKRASARERRLSEPKASLRREQRNAGRE